jgi:nitroimidazol reductase NimA-like FMN-containing flavoprotein (pyridoxamine 5'-phosphate oxidase superfamily)
MDKKDYDKLISEGYVCRIAFQGEKYPYIAPFLYVFDGSFLYFLSTKYGKKLEYFRKRSTILSKKIIRATFESFIILKFLQRMLDWRR